MDEITEETPLPTKSRIIAAAIQAFSSDGYEGASTRQIAALANENQGLITYHFGNKENLWRAAVDELFGGFRAQLEARAEVLADADPATRLRLLIYFLVRYSAQHPEQMRLMVQEGKADSPRTKWLVDRHIEPMYAFFTRMVCDAQAVHALPEAPVVHLFYTLIGATSLIFTHAPECRRLTGKNPMDDAMIDAHAETVANLILRQP